MINCTYFYLHNCVKSVIIDPKGGSRVKNIRLMLDEELHRELKLYAVTNGKKMPDVIIEALKIFLGSQKQEGK